MSLPDQLDISDEPGMAGASDAGATENPDASSGSGELGELNDSDRTTDSDAWHPSSEPSAAAAPDSPHASSTLDRPDGVEVSGGSDAPSPTGEPDPPEAPSPRAESSGPPSSSDIPEASDDEPVDPLDDPRLDDTEFRAALEALLLVVDVPAPVAQLAAALQDTEYRVEAALRSMSADLSARESGIDLRFVGDGWRFYTRTQYAPYVERMLLDGSRSKLTRAALETLAVVAYRQPVTRTRVSAVRGVNVDGVMRTLLARGLIAEVGTDSETNGTLYCTTELFLERIGLASLSDLPPLAPLLPGVDLIDEINESLETDPRYTRTRKPTENDLDLGTEN